MPAYMLLAAFSLIFAICAQGLATTILTAPMAFIGFGALVSTLGLVPEPGSREALNIVAEITLVLLLFLEAAKLDPRALWDRHVWPVRMLLVGLRGLATALFALLVVEQMDIEFGEPVLMLAINAVWISAVLHGITALPGAKLYACEIARVGECAESMPNANSAIPLKTRKPEPKDLS